MERKRRRLLAALAVLLVLAALVAALPALASTAWGRGLVEDAAAERLGRDVDIGGLDAGWGSGVRLSAVRVANRPGWTSDTLFEARTLRVTTPIHRLLLGATPALVIEGATAHLEEREGETNFGDLVPEEGEPEGEPAFSLEIRDSTLVYRRAGDGMVVRVGGVDAAASRADGLLEARARGRIDADGTSGTMEASLTVRGGVARGSLDLANVDLRAFGPDIAGVADVRATYAEAIEVRAEVRDFAAGSFADPRVTLVARLHPGEEEIAIRELEMTSESAALALQGSGVIPITRGESEFAVAGRAPLSPLFALAGAGAAEGSLSFDLKGRATGPAIAVGGRLGVDDFRVEGSETTSLRAELDAALDLDRRELALDRLHATGEALDVDLRGAVAFDGTPHGSIEGSARADIEPLTRLARPFLPEGFELAGHVEVDDLALARAPDGAWSGEASLAARELRAPALAVGSLEARLTAGDAVEARVTARDVDARGFVQEQAEAELVARRDRGGWRGSGEVEGDHARIQVEHARFEPDARELQARAVVLVPDVAAFAERLPFAANGPLRARVEGSWSPQAWTADVTADSDALAFWRVPQGPLAMRATGGGTAESWTLSEGMLSLDALALRAEVSEASAAGSRVVVRGELEPLARMFPELADSAGAFALEGAYEREDGHAFAGALSGRGLRVAGVDAAEAVLRMELGLDGERRLDARLDLAAKLGDGEARVVMDLRAPLDLDEGPVKLEGSAAVPLLSGRGFSLRAVDAEVSAAGEARGGELLVQGILKGTAETFDAGDVALRGVDLANTLRRGERGLELQLEAAAAGVEAGRASMRDVGLELRGTVADLAEWRAMDAAGALRVGAARLPDASLADASARVAVADRALRLSDLAATLNGGRVGGTATVALEATPPYAWSADLELQEVQLDAELSRPLGFVVPVLRVVGGGARAQRKLTGVLTAELDLEGRGFDTAALSRSLAGSGTVNLNDVAVQGSVLLPLLDRGDLAGLLRGKEYTFGDLKVPFRARNGRIHPAPIRITGDPLNLSLDGSTGLDGSIDLRVTTERLSLPLRITGSFASPKLELSPLDILR